MARFSGALPLLAFALMVLVGWVAADQSSNPNNEDWGPRIKVCDKDFTLAIWDACGSSDRRRRRSSASRQSTTPVQPESAGDIEERLPPRHHGLTKRDDHWFKKIMEASKMCCEHGCTKHYLRQFC